ncbi:MAG: hypothetical protein IJR82_03885 [Bacilli bacterium]|nr:hypothetical protein [Bacilli bacterium]
MELMQISKDNFIDTTNEENIKKYQENLNNIIRDTKEKGFIDKYVIIRNDDFFPNDYEWILNCKCTYGEYQKLVAWRKFNNSSRSLKDFIQKIFKSKAKEEKESVQQEDLYLFYPVHFRSTKHFTVNTPLGLTGEYNGVSSRRTFTIIDDINNFLSSGYGYSLSERDAYLDITHESLKISDKAIILLSIDDYNKLKHDEKMMATLSQRQLIVYKGDSSVTINMLLSEKGILPFRTEFQYDDELKQIISESLKKKCKEYSLYYDHCHGGTPSELHFTSYLDCFDNSSLETLSEFI